MSGFILCQSWRIYLNTGVCSVHNSTLVSGATFLSLLQHLITVNQVSPADGTVLHLGTSDGLRVEQVKGMTYSLDALLGVETSRLGSPPSPASAIGEFHCRSMAIVDDHEFASVDGIK